MVVWIVTFRVTAEMAANTAPILQQKCTNLADLVVFVIAAYAAAIEEPLRSMKGKPVYTYSSVRGEGGWDLLRSFSWG